MEHCIFFSFFSLFLNSSFILSHEKDNLMGRDSPMSLFFLRAPLVLGDPIFVDGHD